jgi:hypothetical protein
MSKRDFIIIFCIALLFSAIGGVLGYLFGRNPAPLPLPDYSKYERSIDSLNRLNLANKDSIRVLYRSISVIDSLSLLNIKKVSHDKNLIKSFTPVSRRRYVDSLFKVSAH